MQSTLLRAVHTHSNLLGLFLHRIAAFILISAAPFLSIDACYSEESSPSGSVPNIVLILADDLGWADTTLYGHTKFYETPNVERLARRGMTFTRAYSASPLCSPTRASILTGLSPARIGLTAPTCHMPQVVLEATPGDRAPPGSKATIPNSVSRLDTKYDTLSEALQEAG